MAEEANPQLVVQASTRTTLHSTTMTTATMMTWCTNSKSMETSTMLRTLMRTIALNCISSTCSNSSSSIRQVPCSRNSRNRHSKWSQHPVCPSTVDNSSNRQLAGCNQVVASMQGLHLGMVLKMPWEVLVADLHMAWRQREATSSVLLLVVGLQLVYSQAVLNSVQVPAQLNNQDFSNSVQFLNLAVSVEALQQIPSLVQVQVLLRMILMQISL